uniref:poly(A)-specific ribonuclease n=1 Tax=Glossina brevipalpis TaxID=37001 RepID=A0A1A9WEG3_9MUSC
MDLRKTSKACQVSATPPPQRPWIPLAKPSKARPSCIFTVMCYNVLCDKYATRQMYGYCPSWALSWEYRKKAILDEIRHYSADIISLQEIETEQFYNFFLPELKNEGFEGIFSPKSRAKTIFALIKEHLIEFNQLAMANAEGSDNMLNRVMPKDNIGLAALLKIKDSAWESMTEVTQITQPLLVCTAHIHWDPEFCDVKLVQTMMLSNELKSIIDEASHSFRPGHKSDTNSVQLLLCGDFNSLPDSGVIEFLSKGRVSMDHSDFKDMGYKSCLQRLLSNDSTEFTHSFKLASAYSEDIMPHTNYTFDFKGIIDYIFYTKTGMVPLGLLGPISNDWLRDNKVVGCPHPHIPSDHFPLLVELELMYTASQNNPPNGLINRR